MRLDLLAAVVAMLIGAGSLGGVLWLTDNARSARNRRPFAATAPVSREPTPATAYDKMQALFFYRAPHERFMYVTAGPYELTGGMDVPTLMFQRQGPDGLWYTIEAYPVGFDAWDKARAYDTDAINGRPLNKEEDK